MAPAVVLAVPVLVVATPMLFAAAALADLVRGPRRRRFLRLTGMGLNYVVCEWIGLVVAFALWIATGCGLAMQAGWSRRAHAAVQRWWTGAIFAAARRWLRLEVDFSEATIDVDGPLIVVARHASFVDALVPSVVLARTSTVPTRHVLKRELAWDPCLDVYGHRHPNHFVHRGASDRDAELGAIEELAADADGDVLVIFPEGTFRTATRAAKILTSFAEREPERAARLALHHLLPPRPGGLSALMEGNPDADLIFLAHVGFEPFWSFRAIIQNVPFTEPVRVRTWRIPASDFGAAAGERMKFIDEQWQAMDDWIESAQTTRS